MQRRIVIRSLDPNLHLESLRDRLASILGIEDEFPKVVEVGRLRGLENVFYAEGPLKTATKIFDGSPLLGLRVTWDVRYRNVPSRFKPFLGLPGCKPASSNLEQPDGRGVGIGILDLEGVNEVDALKGRLTRYEVSGGELVDAKKSKPIEHHGTDMASIAAGSGVPSSAPNATIVGVKITGSAVDVQIALREVHKRHPEVRVFCIPIERAKDDPDTPVDERAELNGMIEDLWGQGVVTCVPAGNEGPKGLLQSPATAPFALTVGAFTSQGTCATKDDLVHPQSSRGEQGAPISKPEFLDWWGPRKTAKDGHGVLDPPVLAGTCCAAANVTGVVASWFSAIKGLTTQMLRTVLEREDLYRKVPETTIGGPAAPRHVEGRGIIDFDLALTELQKLASGVAAPTPGAPEKLTRKRRARLVDADHVDAPPPGKRRNRRRERA